MRLPYRITFEPPTGAELRRWFWGRSVWRLFLLVLILAAIGRGALFLIEWKTAEGPAAGTATLSIASDPMNARLAIDGRSVDVAPAQLAVSPGRHVLSLALAGYAAAHVSINPAPGQSLDLRRTLWPSAVQTWLLGPLVPGARIVTAGFLSNGQVAVEAELNSGNRQLWLTNGPEGYHRVGPVEAHGSLALAADAGQIVQLAPTDPNQPAGFGTLDGVWPSDGAGGNARLIYHTADTAGAELTEVSWSPDGRTVLLAQDSQAGAGGTVSRLLALALAGGQPRELVRLPAHLIESSEPWSVDGNDVAFLVRSNSDTSLCALDLGTGAFRYLADEGAAASSTLAFAPATWTSNAQIAFSAPVSSGGSWPFGGSQTWRLSGGSPTGELGTWPSAQGRSPTWLPMAACCFWGRPSRVAQSL